MATHDTAAKVTDGDQLDDGYFSAVAKYLNGDSTANSMTNTTLLTELGQVSIPANTATNGIMVMARGRFNINGPVAASLTTWATIRAGTNAIGSANTAFATATTTNYTGKDRQITNWHITKYISSSDLTFTTANYVQVAGKMDVAEANGTIYYDGMEVLFF